jgi:CDP-6-deoxy-D-xylo-4-hexulose-3-dehydrase
VVVVMRGLEAAGFECRLIVSSNFAKNEVLKYFDYEIHGKLVNADYLDTRGLFIGNHHYPVDETITHLAKF